MAHWTSSMIPPLQGRRVVITGTGGLGLEMALALARSGAQVVIAGRNPEKGAAATQAVSDSVPGAQVRFGLMDLADLRSVAEFAQRLAHAQEGVDILINNAAVMRLPERRESRDGLEMQMATNYFGHFALTGHLLPLLRKGRHARVVTLGSVAARQGAIRLDDLQAEQHYDPMGVYAQSKLACIMFALELERRSAVADWGIRSLSAHPGITRTDLIINGSGRSSLSGRVRRFLWFLFQPAWQGALPALYAATEPATIGGGYYGPDGPGGIRGFPTLEVPPTQALDAEVAAQLWEKSEEITNLRFGEGSS